MFNIKVEVDLPPNLSEKAINELKRIKTRIKTDTHLKSLDQIFINKLINR